MPGDIGRLRDQLDSQVAVFGQGTWALRPRAGTAGRFYCALDRGTLYYDDGSIWRMFAPEDREAARVVGTGGQPAFGTGWYDSGYEPPVAFWRIGSMLHLAGFPIWTGNGFSHTSSIFVLPVGYRPESNTTVMVVGERMGGDVPPTALTIRADGGMTTSVDDLSILYLGGVSIPIVR